MAELVDTKLTDQPSGASREESVRKERVLQVNLRRAIRIGLIGGLTTVFLSAIGMVEVFSHREIIGNVLTLGTITLLLIPFIFGYLASKDPALIEGFVAARRGTRNILAGTLAGLGISAVVIAFVLLANSVNLRSIFLNISPSLMDLLLFRQGLGAGILLILIFNTGLGALAAALHLAPDRWRSALLNAIGWLLLVGLLEDLVAQLMRGVGLGFLTRYLFQGTGGLHIPAAIGIFALILGLNYGLAERAAEWRGRYVVMTSEEQRRWRYVGIGVLILALAILPLILGPFLSEVLDLVGIFLLMALGLNIVVGFAGLLDLGYVAFFAVGAYTTAVVTSPVSPSLNPELTFWAALPFVVATAALAGLLVGAPVIRMRGDYLAIVTLGFGEIARILFLSDWFKPVLGGAQGILKIPNIHVLGFEINTPPEFFYPILLFCALAAYVSWRLKSSRIGRAWMAMREDEQVAEAMGINIVEAKLKAFITGAILAGFGGALFAVKIGSIFPHSFSLLVSITVLVLIIVGGLGSIPGVIVGALALVGIPELLREFDEFKLLVYGVLLILMMLYRPEGLIPSKQWTRELHEEDLSQDAWLDKARAAADSVEAQTSEG